MTSVTVGQLSLVANVQKTEQSLNKKLGFFMLEQLFFHFPENYHHLMVQRVNYTFEHAAGERRVGAWGTGWGVNGHQPESLCIQKRLAGLEIMLSD